MSHKLSRRKYSLKPVSTPNKESVGPILKFRWSVSAAHLSLLEDNSSVRLPAIDTNYRQRKNFAATSSLADQCSVSQSSVSTYKSTLLPKFVKQRHSSTSTPIEPNKTFTQNSPLLLTYAQLRRPSPQVAKRPKQARLSIYPAPDDKQSSMSIINEKISFTPNPSATTVSVLSNKANSRLSNDHLVRLHTPQLRRLNVSEKYLDEVKKLYFDADCRSFVPRASIAEIF